MENENTCKSTWTVHTSKLRVLLLTVSRSLGISETEKDLTIGNKAYLERLGLVQLRKGF